MFEAGELSRPEYAAALWFEQLHRSYSKMICPPEFRRLYAKETDPDSFLGAQVAQREIATKWRYTAALREAKKEGHKAWRHFEEFALSHYDPSQMARPHGEEVTGIRAVCKALARYYWGHVRKEARPPDAPERAALIRA